MIKPSLCSHMISPNIMLIKVSMLLARAWYWLCSHRNRIFCQVWHHTFSDVTHHIPAEYFAKHFGRMFCMWQMCHMWPGITLVCTIHSVKYCLINNFQHLLLHIPSIFTTFNLPTLPGWLVDCGLSTISVRTKVLELSPCSKGTANQPTCGEWDARPDTLLGIKPGSPAQKPKGMPLHQPSPTSPETALTAQHWQTKQPASWKSIMPLSGRIFCQWHHTVLHQQQSQPLRGPKTLTAHASWNIIPEYFRCKQVFCFTFAICASHSI